MKANPFVSTLMGLMALGAMSAPASASKFDGTWRLTFETVKGPCDPSYNFDVMIAGGNITHPNLVRFRGRVANSGVARASVIVQDKSASGSGRLGPRSGAGVWNGMSGADRCSGRWTALRTSM